MGLDNILSIFDGIRQFEVNRSGLGSYLFIGLDSDFDFPNSFRKIQIVILILIMGFLSVCVITYEVRIEFTMLSKCITF